MVVEVTQSVGLLGILYTVVAGNFVSELLSCDTRRALASSMLAKHMIVLFGSLFWVAETTDSQSTTFAQTIMRALVIYAMFVMSAKSQSWTLVPVITLVVIDQILRIYDAKQSRGGYVGVVSKVRMCVQSIAIALIVAGFIAYFRKQKVDHGSAFNMSTFILGVPECRTK